MSRWNGFLPENAIIMARRGVQIHARAELMFIGDTPGELEGDAGQLLTKMFEAMGLKRDQVFITDLENCPLPFLVERLSFIQPKVLVSLGVRTTQTLLHTEKPMNELRNRFHDFHGFKLMPTFDPSYLLQTPSAKKEAWADLQQVAKELKPKFQK